jgi:hypothetical protein
VICHPELFWKIPFQNANFRVLGIKRGWQQNLGLEKQQLVEFMKTLKNREPWMTDAAYGVGPDKWCLDHIKALNAKGITEVEKIARLHYSNVQALSFHNNAVKWAK